MKKLIPILVIGILILGGFGASALNISKIKEESTVLLDDVLDQYQTEMTENAVLPVGQIPIPDNPTNFQVAQSFISTKEVLTRVELYIGKNSTATYPYILAIRVDLTGDDLVLTSVDPEDVVTEDFGWVEFNFDDVATTIGQTYYIVSYTENATDNFYAWGANNESDSYPFGCAWISIDDGDTWGNNSASSQQGSVQTWFNPTGHGSSTKDNVTWDMCFKTYGRGNQAPNTPDITGQTNGKAGVAYDYTFTATDPDSDDVQYYIDWGNGDTEWTSFAASGTPLTVSHTWEEQGDYTITAKAKDIYGAESDWGTLTVTMPVNQQVPQSQTVRMKILQRIFQQFPMLQNLLGI